MSETLGDISARLLAMRAGDVLDILLVAALVYALLYVVRGTRAVRLLRGTLMLALIYFVLRNAASLELKAFETVTRVFLEGVIVAVPVVFQPELRRAIDRLGGTRLLTGRHAELVGAPMVVQTVTQAARSLSERGHGALIVLERSVGLDELVAHGLQLDAKVSVDLILQIFHPHTPLHDGAIIVRGDRIAAARVVIPIGDLPPSDETLGTRHVAAMAISERSDALVVAVSEETSTISLASDGRLTRHLEESSLASLLTTGLVGRGAPSRWVVARRRMRKVVPRAVRRSWRQRSSPATERH
ncbi:MAG: TIGR00159 family protein [Ardenticatenales bacterium]|nr:TIGR00159 family protein [Ardenticatenales bacterium]